MVSWRLRCWIILVVIFTWSAELQAQSALYESVDLHHPVIGQEGMVATQHKEATKVGIGILQSGGNAVDAAVAVGFALAVVLPRAGNLGGGGFMLVYDQEKKATQAVNFREKAPRAAYRDMYLDSDGLVDKETFQEGHLSIGVPGTAAGLLDVHERYGRLSREVVMAPAIRLAEAGFPLSAYQAHSFKQYEARLRRSEDGSRIFFPEKGYYTAGDTLIQVDLAHSLRLISAQGKKAFYSGEIAHLIVSDMKKNGGLINMEDLAEYEVERSTPLEGSYRGYRIAGMPPPSSGGVHILQMLNILEGFPIHDLGHNSAQTIHLMAEAMKRAYADRSKHLGDPLFSDLPIEELISKEYAQELRSEISWDYATPSSEVHPREFTDLESEETTHYTIADGEGNLVSTTYTLNFSYGSGMVAEGTGILMNNEMGDFSAQPGVPNAYGLLGGEANAVEPGKRPLSSMSPVIVFDGDRPYFATGSPGGSRIITTVLQLILNVIDHEMNIAEASHAPRIHHQWYPESLFIEKNINRDTRALLRQMGYELAERPAMGSTQSILIKDGYLYGCSDPRRADALTLGF